jgi:hypothetical protein
VEVEVERRRMESGGNGEVEGLVWGEGSFGVWFGMWDVGWIWDVLLVKYMEDNFSRCSD